MKSRFNLISSLILLPLLTCGAFTWEDKNYALLQDSTVDASGAGVTTRQYPDADEVILERALSIRYNENGTAFQVDDTAVKILTEKGAQNNRLVRSVYNRSYSRAKVPLVQIIKPDGARVPVELKYNTREAIASDNLSSNIYDPNDMVITVNVPGLEPGDILRYIMVDETQQPRVPDTYSDFFVMESSAPIIHSRVTVNAPENMPLRAMAVKDKQGEGPAFLQRSLPGRIVYSWEVRNVPQYFSEPQMPDAAGSLQRVVVSTMADWQELSRWYWKLCEPHLKATPPIMETVRNLTAECDTDSEKIRAIFDFVSQKIRYMGVIAEDAAPGYEPHDVAMTFTDRAGVCRDKAALLAAMLRAAGFESYPVLIHVGARRDAEVPIPYFNHAITAVRDRADNSFVLMDSTDETTRELLPSYLAGCSYLVASPEGGDLATSPVPDADKHMLAVRSNGTISAEGNLNLMSEVVFNGISDNVWRSTLLSIAPEQRRQFFEESIPKALPGAVLRSLTIEPEDLQDMGRALTVVFTAEVPQWLNTGDGTPESARFALMRIPSLSRIFGLSGMIFRNTTLNHRRFPYDARIICGFREELTLRLPENLQNVSATFSEQVDDDTLFWHRRLNSADGALFYANTLYNRKLQYSPGEYRRLKTTLAAVEKADKRQLVCRMKSPDTPDADGENGNSKEEAPDAVILEEETSIEMLDAHTQINEKLCRLQILTYNGVKENSDMSWEYNPAWEDISLLEARVINGGESREVTPEMIHRMDAEWCGGAPRYPAGKLMAVNFPGVQVGSIIEYRLRREVRNRPVVTTVWLMRRQYPADRLSLRIVLPASNELPPPEVFPGGLLKLGQEADTPRFDEHKEKLPDGRQLRQWTAYNCRRIRSEASQPPSMTFVPAVLLSTGSWKEYAGTLAAHIEQMDDSGEAIRKFADGLKELDDEQKMVRIRDFIEMNIRETAPAFTELPLSCLSAPEKTLRDGYGNRADIALLYRALLKACGFRKVELYLASALQAEDIQEMAAKYPVAGLFSDMIVRVDTADGMIWLNEQSRYGQFGTCRYDGCLLLRLSNGALETLRLDEDFANRVRQQQNIRIEEDGSAVVTCTEFVQGARFGETRRAFAQMTPEERSRHFQKLVAKYSRNARALTSDLKTDFTRYPGEISYTVKVEPFARTDDGFCYFQLSAGLRLSAFDCAARPVRENPVCLPNPVCEESAIKVTLPHRYPRTLMMPAKFNWRVPGGGRIEQKLHRTGSSSDGTPEYLLTRSVKLPAAVLPTAHYQSLRKLRQGLEHPSAGTVLLGQ